VLENSIERHVDCFISGYMKMHAGGIHMKYYIVALCAVFVMLSPSLGHTSQPGDMYLRFLEGDVQVKTEDTTEWLPASINVPLSEGDQIWVPENARAELMFREGAIVRLDGNSYLEILVLEGKRVQFYLATGRAYTNTRLTAGDVVVFETPTVSFHADGQSVFGIDVSESEDSVASVFQGVIYADRGSGQMKINAGDRMVFYKYAEYPKLAGVALMDHWEQWNNRRDLEFRWSPSGRATAYLPGELGIYSSDFERNGKWVYEQEYGYVWTPTIIIARDWSPYRVGRWVWMRGDYVWISYEPWGWVPYHYGRWAFVNHRGWCWVPPAKGDVYWSPGFVGWVYTPTYISWVPLAPREMYYGHGNYGHYSVNIRTVNINTSTANNIIYRNIHVNNAVTTLHHDTFVSGRPINVAVKENLLMKEKRVMGAPDIRPERSSFMPVVKEIPQINRPPQQIVNRAIDERGKNTRLTHIQAQGSLPAGPTGNIARTGHAIDKKIERPQSSNNTIPGAEQVPAMKNRTATTGPRELSQERAAKKPDELTNNTIPQNNNIKALFPQQAVPARSAIVPERRIEAPERKVEVQGKAPMISVNEQASRANIAVPQIPKPSENVRSLPSPRSNSPAIATQTQPPRNEERLVVRDIKPQEPRAVAPAPRPDNSTKNASPQNTTRETVPQRAVPVRSAPAPEKKIEVLNKTPELPANDLKIRPEVRQQQNPKPIENVKTAPPVRANVPVTISQQRQQPQKTDDPRIVQRTEQTTQIKPIENTMFEKNRNDFKREARPETDQRRK
jgi:hypothetical protein